jgi:hemoglobin
MSTLFERAGGAPAFERIVKKFYEGVESDAALRALYPTDLEPGKRHLALFLMQFFGGPKVYSQERGHPRLRMRHVPFAIGQAERDAWVHHMKAAVEAENLEPEVRDALLEYFERAATFLINRLEVKSEG